MSVLCFGDSNTYGYDPHGGSRYTADVRWVDLLSRKTSRDVLNAGLNGRCIPSRPYEIDAAVKLIESAAAETVVVMLGSNDLLCGCSAEETAARMERFLEHLTGTAVLLIAPPPMQRGDWVTEERLLAESARLAKLYAALARRLGIAYADAGHWEAELSYDGVHFTEQGHRVFAESLANLLTP